MPDDDNPPRRFSEWEAGRTPPPAFDLRTREPLMGVVASRETEYIVTGYLKNYEEDPRAQIPFAVTFDSGEDEDEFWDNYHTALREAMQDEWGDESPRGGVWVSGVALVG